MSKTATGYIVNRGRVGIAFARTRNMEPEHLLTLPGGALLPSRSGTSATLRLRSSHAPRTFGVFATLVLGTLALGAERSSSGRGTRLWSLGSGLPTAVDVCRGGPSVLGSLWDKLATRGGRHPAENADAAVACVSWRPAAVVGCGNGRGDQSRAGACRPGARVSCAGIASGVRRR